ncbi:outer capsid protein Hoc [Kitasatospora purpeofusca]|uniref:phage tail tube protein n=1 Tax=Kitasatospora purpeofusca TaxID=67352 RepID=UPI00225279FA|nr:phage tail tube protein [Kitasatospora purpeofusca]MCX4686762.1 outer capsid protein Hoc [Kitasatospora purpeofusca]
MAGLDGYGTKLRRGDGATPQVFTEIAEITNIDGPSLAREAYDGTTHGSPDGWREFVPGLKDAGEVSTDINYHPSMHNVLVGDLDDKDPRSYELEFPDGSVWKFKAILTAFGATAPHDGLLTASCTWKITGKPVLA